MAKAKKNCITKSHCGEGANADPVFAAIERHRSAYIAWLPYLAKESTASGEAHKKAVKAATPFSNAVDRAEKELGEIVPTSVEGVLALLDHIEATNADRIIPEEHRVQDEYARMMTDMHTWPDWERPRKDLPKNKNGFHPDDSWPFQVMRNIRSALVANRPASSVDPIFELIETYEKKLAEYNDAISAEPEGIASDRREWHSMIDDKTPPKGCKDDPRWIAYQINMSKAGDTAANAMQRVVSTRPLTLRGTLALMEFIDLHERDGMLCDSTFTGEFDADKTPIYFNQIEHARKTVMDALIALS